MSKRISETEENLIGRYVYQPYRPQIPGKIIEDHGPQEAPNSEYTWRIVTVEFLDGKKELKPLMHLNDFQSLIDDHEKKLKTHKDKLKELDKL